MTGIIIEHLNFALDFGPVWPEFHKQTEVQILERLERW
jgi:hypothetical protein